MTDRQLTLGSGIKAGVSRETLDRLEHYEQLLLKWSKRINLVSASTLNNVWSRHILDSAQLIDVAPIHKGSWLDLGSGAGFPGLVISILNSGIEVTLIESDQRKAAFLRTVIRETGAQAQVLSCRIEDVSGECYDVVSARALAPLAQLLSYAEPHLASTGTALFPKGQQYKSEINEALETWRFDCQTYESRTQPDAFILALTEISRA